MQEERRVVSALQETFVAQISELGVVVGKLNVNMDVHTDMMKEIKENQKEFNKLVLTVERNSIRIEEANRNFSQLRDIHSNCGIVEVTREVSDISAKIGLIGKVLAVLCAGLVPVLYKTFL